MTKYFIRMFMIIPLLLGMSIWATHEPAPASTVALEQPPRAQEIARRVDNRPSRFEVRVPIKKPVDFSQPTLSPVPPPPKPKPTVKPKVKKTAKPTPRQTTKASAKISGKVSLSGIAACIAKYESGSNPKAQNPRSSASGLFQFVDGTWNNYKGYARAKDAPASVQTEKFYQVWDGGRGSKNWVVSPKCGYAGYYD